jgi:glycine cleavage system H lipoate-binding protein
MYPKDYRYTKEHEWIKADGTSGMSGTIGITMSLGTWYLSSCPRWELN